MPVSTVIDPRRFWDGRYSEVGWAYGCEPNDFLRDQAQHLPAGDAFCLAEGQGLNGVIWPVLVTA